MSDLNAVVTYRHDVTGLVGVYPVRLGDNDPHLKRVKPDAKPLLPALIPHRAPRAAAGDTPEVTSGETSSSTNTKKKRK